MSANKKQPKLRCAIYTRKSTSEGLEAEITSLDVQHGSRPGPAVQKQRYRRREPC